MKHFKTAFGSGCDARRFSTGRSIRAEAESYRDAILRLAAGDWPDRE
jgi:hypothetical protein